MLIDAARTCSFVDFKNACDYWLIAVDPDGDEPKDQADKTYVSIHRGRGGRKILRGELDAVNGAAVETAINNEAQKLLAEDAANSIKRSEGQRRAQALTNLITRGAAREDGTHPAPLINIAMSIKVAEWLLQQQANPTTEPVPVAWNDPDGRCELIDGTPIHPKHLLATLGVATLRRIVMDADSRPLDYSYNARSFPEPIRTVLTLQARGQCETHGCDSPHHWLQTDHIDPVSNGGSTSYRNGQPQCGPDNKAKGSQTGHTPWRDRPPPPRYQRHQDRSDTDDEDA